jgi:hypothetical protein
LNVGDFVVYFNEKDSDWRTVRGTAESASQSGSDVFLSTLGTSQYTSTVHDVKCYLSSNFFYLRISVPPLMTCRDSQNCRQ